MRGELTIEKLEKILAEGVSRPWWSCAEGIAALRNLAPLMLEVCKAAEDDAIMWNEEYCNRQECEQMSAAQARLTKAVTNLKAALADGSAP